MRITDDRVLDGVVFIGAVDERRGEFIPLGTGFLVAKSDQGFLFQMIVTARHVVENMAGDRVFVRLNLKTGGTEIIYTLKSDWKFHPDVQKGHYVDVAILPSHIPADRFDIKHMNIESDILKDSDVKEQNIGVGDDVFMVGMFTNHYGAAKNIPVVRCGTIACMPQEPMRTDFGFVEGYLVEALSLGGLSGSPVFVQSSIWRVDHEGQVHMREGALWYFLGLMCGHWLVQNPEDAVVNPDGTRETGNINTGMGIVVPASKIMETIDQSELAAARAKIIANKQAQQT